MLLLSVHDMQAGIQVLIVTFFYKKHIFKRHDTETRQKLRIM